jgi:3-oxoacyl-[acyl-carrier-protein] synthase II
MGLISPLGSDTQSLWDALVGGRSGVATFSMVPPETMPVAFGAEARDFHGSIEDFGPLAKEQTKAIRKGLKVMCRECQMGVAAAQRALADAGLTPGRFDPDRVGIEFGTDHMVTMPEEFSEGILKCLDNDLRFDFLRWATDGMPKMNPLWLLKYLPNMPASHLAIYNDLRGPNNSLTLREAAANVAVGEARQIILRGQADAMLVGATGTRIHPIKAIHARQQEELAECDGDPQGASRPFDRDRTGMVLGEGAAAIVLEERAGAEARGATIYAEVLAGTSSSVAGRDRVAQRGLAMKNALEMALRFANVRPEDVGFVTAHGLSTRTADIEEAWAINQVFGGRARPVPVVAPKSHFGNLGAGSGMVELIAGVMALRHGHLFPVLNYRTPDPECPISVVTSTGEPNSGGCFAKLSVTPQGQASASLVVRCEG